MFEKINFFIGSTILGLMLTGPVAAEKAEEDFSTWVGIAISGDLPTTNPNLKNFKYMLIAQGRFGDNSSRFTQSLIRPCIGYRLNKSTAVEIGYQNHYINRPQNPRPDLMNHILSVNMFLNF